MSSAGFGNKQAALSASAYEYLNNRFYNYNILLIFRAHIAQTPLKSEEAPSFPHKGPGLSTDLE